MSTISWKLVVPVKVNEVGTFLSYAYSGGMKEGFVGGKYTLICAWGKAWGRAKDGEK